MYVNSAIVTPNGAGRVLRAGQPALAAADTGRALELGQGSRSGHRDALRARTRLALLAGLGKGPKSGVTAAQAAAFAEESIRSPRSRRGGLEPARRAKEPDFDAIRDRVDFKKLVAELTKR